MTMKRVIFVAVLVILIAGNISVDAASTASSPAGEPWTLEHVDWYEGSHVGSHVSIAHHPKTGKAYISYYDSVNTALKMAHEVSPGTGNCGPGKAWECETVQSSTSVGKYTSIDVVYVPMNPVILSYTKIGISFYDASAQRLRYAECSESIMQDCTWLVYNVDDSGDVNMSVGQYSSLKFDRDNVPHIAYHIEYTPGLFDYGGFKYATQVGGAAGNCIPEGDWDCEVVDTSEYPQHGTHISLALYAGVSPRIAFYNAKFTGLETATRVSGDCTNSNWECEIIDDGYEDGTGVNHDVGKFASLAYSGMVPLYAYYDATAGKWKYAAYNSTFDGNCTNSLYDCYQGDSIGMISGEGHLGLSLAVDGQGLPVIVYMKVYTDGVKKLRVARPASAFGLEYGNCGDVPPGNLFQYWQCQTIDPGASYADEAEFAAVSVNPAGLATIAYSEYNSRDSELYLKVARQHFAVYLPFIKK